jgi:O-acetylhomoserine/O-acetylserine sulfhydrylase-like pyridoxal-dependent enzyme
LSFTFVDSGNSEAVASAVTPQTKIVYAETPTNPMMRLCDLAALGAIAKRAGALFVVDNTFATPCFQRPLEFGADLVLHSTTKYLNGHSDMVGGMLVTARDDLAERLAFIQNGTGAVPGPFDCWLALRGIKTLLRMRAHDGNGRRIAEWLERRPGCSRVYYPDCHHTRNTELACRQMSGFGGMLSLSWGRGERAGSSALGIRARRVAGRRESHRTSGVDDARQCPTGAAAEDGAERQSDSPVGGNRGCRGPNRGSGPSAGRLTMPVAVGRNRRRGKARTESSPPRSVP